MCKPCNVQRYQPPSDTPIWMQSKDNQEAFIKAVADRVMELMDVRFRAIEADIADMKADITNMKANMNDMKADMNDMKADIANVKAKVGL